jgi:hypothetical protein
MANLSIKTLKTLNTVTTIGILMLNFFAGMGYINDLNPGKVSAMVDTRLTPASITFSIWSVIFLLLIGFTIFQYFPKAKFPAQETLIRGVDIYYFLSFVGMTGWTFAWHYTQFGLSVLCMLFILGSLAALFARLTYLKEQIQRKTTRLLTYTTFGIYLGWISVALSANISSWLVAIEWSRWQVPIGSWATGVLTLLFLITLVFLEKFRALGFAVAVSWGLLGIFIKHYNEAAGSLVIQGFCLVAIILIAILITSMIYRKYKHLSKPPIL